MSIDNKNLKSGIKWNSISQMLNQSSTFICGFILMRLLTPEDFGLVAIVSIFIGFANVLSKIGLSSSIVNKKDVNKFDYDNIFTFSFLIGLILSLFLLFLSSPLSIFFNDMRLEFLFQISAVILLISPITAIPSAIIKRKLDFKKIALIDFFSVTISLLVSILMAYNGYGYYSLIAQSIVRNSVRIFLLFIVTKYRPSFRINIPNLKEHLAFGIPILGSRVVNYGIGNFDKFIIGKYFGTSSLGSYSRAYSLVSIPSVKIGYVINSSLFPVFSNMKNKNLDIKPKVLKLYELMLYFLFLLSLILIVISNSIIQIISPTGEWDAIIPIIQALAIVSIFKPINRFYSSILASLGLTKLSFNTELIGGFIILAGFVIGVNFDILYFSYIYCFTSLIFFIYYSIVFSKHLKFNISELFKLFKFKFFDFCLVGVYCCFFLSIDFSNPYIELSTGVISVIFLWCVLNFIFERETSKSILRSIKSFI